MINTKEEILKNLVYAHNEDKFYFEKWEAKAKQRSLAQNNAFYRCFTVIGLKMGVAKETVKQNSLKALFGVEKSKFGGVTYENAIKPHTSELNIEEATLLLETLIEFGKKLGCGEIISSRELLDLFNNN